MFTTKILILLIASFVSLSPAISKEFRIKPSAQEIDQCMRDKLSRKTESQFKADSDRIDRSRPAARDFEGSGEMETMAFFRCRNVELDGKFDMRGVFSDANAMSAIERIRWNWSEDSEIVSIEFVGMNLFSPLTGVEFDPDEGFRIKIWKEERSFHKLSESIQYLGTDSAILQLYEKGFTSLARLFEPEYITAISKLFEAKAFDFQGGNITSFRWFLGLSQERDTSVRYSKGKHAIRIGRYCTKRGYIEAFCKWLGAGSSQMDFLQSEGLVVDASRDLVFPGHIIRLEYFKEAIESGRLKVTSIELDYFSSGDANTYLERDGTCVSGKCPVILHLGEDSSGNIDQYKPFISPQLGRVIEFYDDKEIPIPNKITLATLHNLGVIADWWDHRLKLSEIKLHDEENEIRTETSWRRSPHNVIYLNSEKKFDGYTELVQDYYLEDCSENCAHNQ